MQRWYWYRRTYENGHVEESCTLASSVQEAHARVMHQERGRVALWETNPKRNWKRPPNCIRISMIQEPPELRRLDPGLAAWLDTAARVASNGY